jgi:hypothetical protein
MADETDEQRAEREEREQREREDRERDDDGGGDGGREQPATLEAALERITALERVTAQATSQAAGGRRRIRELERELETTRERGLSEQERAIAAAKREGREEAERELASKLVRSEVVAAAAGRLRDPEDAFRYLPLDELVELDDSDRKPAIRRELDKLLEDKEYLAAGNGDEDAGRGRRGMLEQGTRRRVGERREPDGSDWLRKAARR